MKLQKNNKLKVALLFGGQSTEHEVSLSSSLNIIRIINRQQYDLILIGVDKCGRWMLCNEQNYLLNPDDTINISLVPTKHYIAVIPGKQKAKLVNIFNNQPLPLIDIVFSLLHGANGENGSVQGLLNILNIPYIGSDVLGSAICMDKDMTKRVLRDAGIKVTPSVTLMYTNKKTLNFNQIVDRLGLPLFIKPVSQGSSIGISKVSNRFDFDAAIELAFQYDTKILIEQAIIGREIEVALLGNDHIDISVCGEILTHNEFYTYNNKYSINSKIELVIPAKITTPIINTIQSIALQAYLALNCSITARLDFFLTNHGKILLNEVNTIPGFTSASMYPKLWKASGLGYSKLIDRLIKLTLARAEIAQLKLNKKNKQFVFK